LQVRYIRRREVVEAAQAAGSDQVILLILQVKYTGNSCFFALKRSFGAQNGHYEGLGNPFGVVHLL